MRLILCTIIVIASGATSVATAFDAKDYYSQKCMSCHTVGGGDDVGPDLKGIESRRDRAWTIRFIKESQAMIKEGDPVSNQLFTKYKNKKMPDHDLTDEEAGLLIDFIAKGEVVAVEKSRPATDANAYEIKMGESLFTGETRFKNGGPSCLSCHSAGDAGYLGGGRLGPDLSRAYSTYGDNGLSKVMKSINFPTMVEVYRKNKLEDDEIFQLKAFLHSTDQLTNIHDDSSKKFLFIVIVATLLLFGVMDLVWIRRKKNSPKK